MQVEHIYGIDYEIPDPPKKELIYNNHKSIKDQLWEKQDLPSFMYDISYNDEDDAVFTEQQQRYIEDEIDRILNGFWYFNCGVLTFITGAHYFYLQYYTLEDGNSPSYRDTDRRWFYFFDYCYNHQYIDGIIRIKKRREGASSQVASIMLMWAMFFPNSNCGIISKTGKDAEDVFQKMITPAFTKLPEFIKPRVEDAESKTNLNFIKAKVKKRGKKTNKVYNKDRGLESKIDFRATKLNSYDSGRVSILLADESGKYPAECPINQYWPIVRKTLRKGLRRVGFAFLISTVNDAENGGTEYKTIWDGSNHLSNKITGSGLYRYFSPAEDGLEGFIDKYGRSIIENASESFQKELENTYGQKYTGARDYILSQRKLINDPVQLAEEIRMMPLTESEAFMISQSTCHFSVAKINDQIEYLSENYKKHYKRRGKFYEREDGTVDFLDLDDGPWRILRFPPLDERNKKVMTDKGWGPANTAKYANGIDPHRHSHTKGKTELSKTSAWLFERYDNNDPDNTGLPIAWYYDRPTLKDIMYDQMMLAARFYGVKVHFETDAGDDYYLYYKLKGLLAYIRWTPTCAINPLKPGNKVAGTSSKDPFALSKQLELCIAYIEHNCHKIYFIEVLKEFLLYKHDDRQAYDIVVSFMIALIDLMGDVKPTKQAMPMTTPLINIYNLLENSHPN